MAVFPIPNQAFDLTQGESVYCRVLGKTYYQIYPQDECTEFEVRLGEETGVEIFSNPNLNNLSVDPNGWNWTDANVSNNQVILFPTGQLWQEVTTLTIGEYYRLCFEIKEITVGQAVCVIPDGSTVFLTQNCFDKKGVHCVYFYAADTTETFFFSATGAQGSATLDSATLKEISEPTVEIYTCEGDLLGAQATVDVFKDFAKITFCWESVDAGCYKICVGPVPETAFSLFDGENLITTEGGRSIGLETGTSRKLRGIDNASLTWIE